MDEAWAEKHYNVEFSNNVEFTLRDTPGYHKLAGSRDSYKGSSKAKITNRFGRLKMEEKVGRNVDTDTTDISSETPWIKPRKMGTVAPLVDIEDEAQTSIDLGSPLVKEVAEAAAVYHDDSFFLGFFGTAYRGEGGDTAVPFKAANIIPHGGTGLTKAKLIQLRTMMRTRNAPYGRQMPIIGVLPEDEADLLGIEEYVNNDYNGSKPLTDGELKPWLGFRFLPINPDTESLPASYSQFFADNGATRNLPVFFQSGMHFGSWIDFLGAIDRRPDKNQSTQYWGGAKSGAARTDEDLAYIIKTQ